jgi:hypothetical protein
LRSAPICIIVAFSFVSFSLSTILGNALASSNSDVSASGSNIYAANDNDGNSTQTIQSKNLLDVIYQSNEATPIVLFPTQEEVAQYLAEVDAQNFTKISANTTGNASDVQITASATTLYILWQDTTANNSEIYLSLSRDEGLKFLGLVNLSNNTGNSTNPRIAVLENEVYVAWQDTTPGNSDIFLSVSMDSGKNFKTFNFSNSTSQSIDPHVSTEGNLPFLEWIEIINGTQVIYGHPIGSW